MGDEDADTGKDSGNESAEADSDSEDKKESIKAIQNALVGMNVSSQIRSFKHFNQTVFLMRNFDLHRAWIISRQISSGADIFVDLSMIRRRATYSTNLIFS